MAVMPLYLAVRNPFVATPALKERMRLVSRETIDRFTEVLKAKGHDGVVLDHGEGGIELMSFEPTQVRNRGVFDVTKPDIQFRLAEQVAKSDTGFYAPATSEHRALAERFRERIARSRPGTVFHAVAASGGTQAGRAATGAVERGGAGDPAQDRSLQAVQTVTKRLFGHEVVFVKFDGLPLFNGAMSDAIPGVVFINVESKCPHMAVLGHELLQLWPRRKSELRWRASWRWHEERAGRRDGIAGRGR